ECARNHLPLHGHLDFPLRFPGPCRRLFLYRPAAAALASAGSMKNDERKPFSLSPAADPAHRVVDRQAACQRSHSFGRIGIADHHFEEEGVPSEGGCSKTFVLPTFLEDADGLSESLGSLKQRDDGQVRAAKHML